MRWGVASAQTDPTKLPVQPITDSVPGTEQHREYHVDIHGTTTTPEDLSAAVRAIIGQMFAPQTIQKVDNANANIKLGETFEIGLKGPLNAPIGTVYVRAIAVSDTSWTFATLKGHVEAGTISFTASSLGSGNVRFSIESFAGNNLKGAFGNFLPNPFGTNGASIQRSTWENFLWRTSALAIQMGGGTRDRPVINSPSPWQPLRDAVGF